MTDETPPEKIIERLEYGIDEAIEERERKKMTETTSEPITIEWTGGTDNHWQVTVDPYLGAVIIGDRVFDVSTLVSDDIPSAMYHTKIEGESDE